MNKKKIEKRNVVVNKYVNIGYNIYGPILKGFSDWLNLTCQIYQIDKLLLASRDCYILQKSLSNINCDIEYFFVSRKSAVIPLLQYYDSLQEKLQLYKSWPQSILLSHVLDRLGINDICINEYNLSSQDTWNSVNSLVSDDRVQKLYNLNKSRIIENSRLQGQLLYKYIERFNHQCIGLVDFGSGTIISALSLFCSKNNLVINWKSFNFQGNTKLSFVNFSKNIGLKALFRFSYILLELFFTAPHPSVKMYREKNNLIYPIYEDVQEEQEVVYCRTRYLHEGALQYCKKNRIVIDDINQCFLNYYNYFGLPTKSIIKRWENELIEVDSLIKLLNQNITFMEKIKNTIWLSGTLRQMHIPRKFIYILIKGVILLYLIKRKGGLTVD